MSEKTGWEQLFRQGDHIRLALAVRESGAFTGREIRALADDRICLLGGAREAARLSKRPAKKDELEPHCVVVTPVEGQSRADYLSTLSAAREEFPQCELAGFGPAGWSDENSHLDRLVLKLGEAGDGFQEESGWKERLGESAAPKTLVLVYSPAVTAGAIHRAAELASQVESLCSVVALPKGAGDRIPLPGLTTSGATDQMVVSALRLLLPSHIRVRASWAALGWKVAQLSLLYGADELAGWTAAETAVYTGRVRAAARVEEDEVLCGLEEADFQARPWREKAVGATS